MKQQVNLYRAQYPSNHKSKFPSKIIFMVVLCVGAFLAGGFGYLQVVNKREQLVSEKRSFEKMEKQLVELKKFNKNNTGEALEKELSDLLSIINRKKNMTVEVDSQINFIADGFSKRYVALARQDIKGLWLESIEFDEGEERVTLRGETKSVTLLTNYLDKLKREPAFSGVSFRELKVGETIVHAIGIETEEKTDFLPFIVSTHEVIEETEDIAASLLP